jgi:hypothetical protein
MSGTIPTPGTMAAWADLASVTNLDGVPPGSYTASVQVSTSQDGTTWSAYVPYLAGTITGRKFKFLVTLTTNDPSVQAILFRCNYSCTMQSRIESASLVLTPASPMTVSFSTPFKMPPTVTPINRSMAPGDYYIITAITDNNFTIQWYNGLNAAVSRYMDWTAIGFGGQ